MSQPNSVAYSKSLTSAFTVTTAGTAYLCPAVALSNRLRIRIQNTSTTAKLYVGGSNVGNSGTNIGVLIDAGDQDEFDYSDGLYLTSDTNGATATIMEMA